LLIDLSQRFFAKVDVAGQNDKDVCNAAAGISKFIDRRHDCVAAKQLNIFHAPLDVIPSSGNGR
jgi:hypothetical protein